MQDRLLLLHFSFRLVLGPLVLGIRGRGVCVPEFLGLALGSKSVVGCGVRLAGFSG